MTTTTPAQPPPQAAARTRPALMLRPSQRMLLVLFNYIPPFNVLITAALVFLPAHYGWPRWTWLLAPAWLLLAPPMVVRLTLALRPLSATDIPLASAPFFTWWFTAQWQVIFNRLPWIEEMIRLVPGLYSGWLRLWGARVGKLVYWTPGLRILDRPLVDIGDHVVFGVAVRVNPHVIVPDENGQLVLRAARVRIGADALVGGYSLLFAGCWIAAGEIAPGKREFRPFTGWEGGRRVTAASNAADEEAHA